MSNIEPSSTSASIVLLGYNASSSTEFEKSFNGICELDALKDFKFEKSPIKFIFEDGVPEKLIQNFVLPISKFNDEINKIMVEFDASEKKLVVQQENTSNLTFLQTVAQAIVDEQAYKLEAIGFNFSREYKGVQNKPAIFSKTTQELNEIAYTDKNIERLTLNFNYKQDDYKITYTLTNLNNEISINANFHFDKFKNVRSTRQIRETAIEEIKDKFAEQFSEFNSSSMRLIGDDNA